MLTSTLDNCQQLTSSGRKKNASVKDLLQKRAHARNAIANTTKSPRLRKNIHRGPVSETVVRRQYPVLSMTMAAEYYLCKDTPEAHIRNITPDSAVRAIFYFLYYSDLLVI
jgi:hypothetical protein